MKVIVHLLFFLIGLIIASTCLLHSLYAQSPITIVFADSYEPFAWKEGNEVRGVQADMVKFIFEKRLNIPVTLEAYPWKRCQVMVKNGQKDAMLTAATIERASYSLKTEQALYLTNFIMHTSRNNKNRHIFSSIQDISELEQYPKLRHVYMLGSGWHNEKLKEMKNIVRPADAQVITQMLATNRVDLYIEQAELFSYQTRKYGYTNSFYSFTENPIEEISWHIMISKKSRYVTIMPELNSVIMAMKKSGELENLKLLTFIKYDIRPEPVYSLPYK